MRVTQAARERKGEGAKKPRAVEEDGAAFDSAVSEFLSYLQGYRQYSPWTIGAYRTDLREFRVSCNVQLLLLFCNRD